MFQRSSIGVGNATTWSIVGELDLHEQDHLRDADGRDEQQQARLVEQPPHHEQLGEPADQRARRRSRAAP